MKFAALNKEPSESASRLQASGKKIRPTKEAQESGCLQRYHEAIRLQQDGHTDGARALYHEILGSKVMDEAEGGMLLKLKFLIFKNLGSIARSHGDSSAAVDAYIEAVGVDNSDVTVWFQLAQASCNLGNLLLGRTALEEARKCHAHYWPAADLLSTVLLALEDYAACLQLISMTLEHCPHFPRGLAYLHHVAAHSPELLASHPNLRLHLMKPHPPNTEQFVEEATELARRRSLLSQVMVMEEPLKPPSTLAYYSLYSLGKSLMSIYNHCKHLSHKSPSMATPVDLQQLCVGTSDRPLLPAVPPATVLDVASSSGSSDECGERGGRGEEGRGREGKRRTPDLVHSLLPKRRSSRVKTKREQVSVSERFAQFLPDRLRGCELGDVCALSPPPSSGCTPPSQSLTDQSDCSSLDSAPRISDSDVVKCFLQDHDRNSGIIDLVYCYLLLLAQHYNWRWAEASFPVVRMYVELYELVQPHLVSPSPLCSTDDSEHVALQDMAMISLCYSELRVEALQRTASIAPLPPALSHALSFSQLACGGKEKGRWKGRAEFTLRVYWCLFKLKTLQTNMSDALTALQRCCSVMEHSECQPLVLANLRQDAHISPDQVHKKMKTLEQVMASDQVYALFQAGDHASVVQILRPMLDWNLDNNSQFLLGGDHGDERQPPLSLLLTSLVSLDKRQECVECCVHALTELMLHYKLGNESWVKAVRDTYTHLDKCLSEGGVGVLRQCGEKLQRHLVVCVFKTLDLHVEMMDSPLLSLMPLCLPWSVLYTTLLSVWATDCGAMETNIMDTEDPVCPVAMVTDSVTIRGGSPAAMTNQESSGTSGTEDSVITMATSDQLEVSLRFLCAAHEYLGSSGQGWCVQDGGCLLTTVVVRLREELRVLSAHPHKTRETLLRELEQCYYCLYGHPHKKAKAWGLQDHGAEQLPLTWESAQVLLEFYHPSFLPAVEENKALTPELVSLYQRLVDVVPDTGKVLCLEVIAGYIEGRIESLPLPALPAPHTALVSEIFYLLADDALKSSDFLGALHNYTQSVCYCPERVDTWAGLALARARSIMKKLDRRDVRSGMDSALQKQVTPTLRCFKRALALGSQHRYISEKYGLFCYTVQSYCSQLMTQPALGSKAEVVVWARRTRQGLLQLAQQCFTSALSEGGVARVWPWFYSLVAAKAGMKLGWPAADTLPLLVTAAEQLHTEETTPPATVELKGQWMTSVEVHYQIYSCALKYLLRCERGERGDVRGGGGGEGREGGGGEGRGGGGGEGREGGGGEGRGDVAVISEVVGKCQRLPLGRVGHWEVREWVRAALRGHSGVSRSRTAHSDGESHYGTAHFDETDAVSLLVQRVIADAEREVALETVAKSETAMDTDNEPLIQAGVAPSIGTSLTVPQLPHSELSQLHRISEGSHDLRPSSSPLSGDSEATPTSLLEQCVYGVALCSVRCPAYYKSLYRLASTLHSLGHSQVARSLLLGPLPEPLLQAQDKLQPLFVLKPNIFANFWQIPVEEINRPGRFSSYARCSVQLLCDVLSQQRDSASLVFLVQHLRSRPDSSRQYLRDYERVAMCQKALQCCISVHKHLIGEAESWSNEKLQCLLMETYTLRSLAQKSDNKQHTLSKGVEGNLVELYQLYLSRCPLVTSTEAPPTSGGVVSAIEEAVRYCQGYLSRPRADK